MTDTPLSIAIIGAGLTGLSVANALKQEGLAPVLFDKSRGIGGRLATRRVEGELSFDHGAPFVSTAEASFRSALETLVAEDSAAIWGPTGPWRGRKPWHVGRPGMSSLPRGLADGLTIHTGREISSIDHRAGGWELTFTEDQEPARADRLIVTIPAPQAARLLADHPLAADVAAVKMAPCLTMMAAFDQQLGLLFDALKAPSSEFSWIIRNASKPGRLRLPEAWIAHASPEWSAEHLELEKPEIASALFALLPDAMEVDLPQPIYLAGHRWRYAFAQQPLGTAFLADPSMGLYIGGDWCLGPLAEDGWRSGQALAKSLLDNL